MQNELKVNTDKINKKDFSKVSHYISKYQIHLIFIIMVIILSVMTPAFLRPQNLINVIRQISIVGIISIGMTFIIISGGIDLSAGAIVALVSVAAAIFGQQGKYSVIVTILVACSIGIICGLINGVLIAKTKIAPFIATLGVMSVARGIALLISNGEPIDNLSKGFEFLGSGYILIFPVPIVIFTIIIVMGTALLNNMKFGKYIYGIGGNEKAASICGINVAKYKIYIYTLEGLLCGIAGLILTARISAGSGTVGVGYEMDAITAVVIGGTSMSGGIGKLGGTLVGVLIIGVLNNGLDLLHVSPYWQQILKGIIIVVAVILDVRRRQKNK